MGNGNVKDSAEKLQEIGQLGKTVKRRVDIFCRPREQNVHLRLWYSKRREETDISPYDCTAVLCLLDTDIFFYQIN